MIPLNKSPNIVLPVPGKKIVQVRGFMLADIITGAGTATLDLLPDLGENTLYYTDAISSGSSQASAENRDRYFIITIPDSSITRLYPTETARGITNDVVDPLLGINLFARQLQFFYNNSNVLSITTYLIQGYQFTLEDI